MLEDHKYSTVDPTTACVSGSRVAVLIQEKPSRGGGLTHRQNSSDFRVLVPTMGLVRPMVPTPTVLYYVGTTYTVQYQ